MNFYVWHLLQYGDSFTEEASDESLREAFKKVGEKVNACVENFDLERIRLYCV